MKCLFCCLLIKVIISELLACAPILPVEVLPVESGSNFLIFLDSEFHCDMLLTGWQYYAYDSGTINADIFRPLGNDQYELVKKFG